MIFIWKVSLFFPPSYIQLWQNQPAIQEKMLVWPNYWICKLSTLDELVKSFSKFSNDDIRISWVSLSVDVPKTTVSSK